MLLAKQSICSGSQVATEIQIMSAQPDSYRPLGSTGLFCHPLGFGCYRIADGNEDHEAALTHYLERGGNLIDTSANYTDGQRSTSGGP